MALDVIKSMDGNGMLLPYVKTRGNDPVVFTIPDSTRRRFNFHGKDVDEIIIRPKNSDVRIVLWCLYPMEEAYLDKDIRKPNLLFHVNYTGDKLQNEAICAIEKLFKEHYQIKE